MKDAHVPTVFLSAASDDLESLRNVLHGAFSRAHLRVFTQKRSLGAPDGDLRDYLVKHIDQSDFVVHLAGSAYGSDASLPFPEAPSFQCSWTQFEYYYAHQQGKRVIALVCAPSLSSPGFQEKGDNTADISRKQALQEAHRERVQSGEFTGTPLAGKVKRTLNEKVENQDDLIQAIVASVATMLNRAGTPVSITPQPHLHTLPDPPVVFIGRDTDLAQLRNASAAGTVLTGLRGMGGIGKSALALVLAHEWLPRFPDAQLFLNGRGTQPNPPSAAELLAQIIHTFAPTAQLPDHLDALKGIYHDLLHDRRVLILLDNARDASQATPLIPPAGCALIVTSRQNFMLGKRAAHTVGRLPDDQATALLREFHPALTDADAAELVRLCAGLPLALKLAGAHLALDASERGGQPNIAGYLNRLRSGRLATLDADAADANEITISETLRLSEEQLSPEERTAWRKLGVFRASFEATAAAAIAGTDETMLDQFVRRSLLEREGTDRYKLHDLVADYTRERIGEAELATLHLVHAYHFAKVGAMADDLYLEGKVVAGLAIFDRERAQIEAAFAWLRPQLECSSVKANASECILVDVVTAGPRQKLKLGATALLALLVNAVVYTGQELRFHPRQRISWLEAQLNAARLLGLHEIEVWAIGNLGIAHYDLGDARKAIDFYEQSLIIARQSGNQHGESNALINLSLAYGQLGDARKTIEFAELALPILRELGDKGSEGNMLMSLGNAQLRLGNASNTINFNIQALSIFHEIGDRRGEGHALVNLGGAHLSLEDADISIAFSEQALPIFSEIGDRRGVGITLMNLGNAHASIGQCKQSHQVLSAIYLHRERDWGPARRSQCFVEFGARILEARKSFRSDCSRGGLVAHLRSHRRP